MPLNINLPTATDARKRCEEVQRDEAKQHISLVESMVTNAIEAGNEGVIYKSRLNPLVVDGLKMLGYKVQHGNSQLDGDWCEISW